MEECALASGWQKTSSGWKLKVQPQENLEPHKKRGIGISCGFKNIGYSIGYPERSWAKVEIIGEDEIEKVFVHQAGADVGQGAHTVFKQMAADAVEVSLEKIVLKKADTAHTKDSGSSSASRMTFMAGNAIKGAAARALDKWNDGERPACVEYKYVPPKTTPLDSETGEAMPNFAYGYVVEVVEVEVDTETGEVKILKVVCADDVGKAINPKLIEGQIEGAIVQAVGYAVLENFVQKDGFALTDKLSTYLIPTVYDIPDEIESIILEYGDQEGPWGVRGMAEMPYIPLAPAVMAAVHDAVGVWYDDFPLVPERVLKGLGKI
jgi:CO/xanthine dehydrogenase Mo-binding subunit